MGWSTTEQREDVAAGVKFAWEATWPSIAFDAAQSWGDLGVDSLSSLQFVLRLERQLGKAVGFDGMTPDSTAEDLIALINRDVVTGGHLPLLFLVPGVFGDEPKLARFRRALKREVAFAVLDLPDIATSTDTLGDIEATAAVLEAVVRRDQPEGAVRIAGYSFGALVAQALAARLEAAGRAVDLLIILDGLRDPQPRPRDRPVPAAAPVAGRDWTDLGRLWDDASFSALLRVNACELARRRLLEAAQRRDEAWLYSRRRWLLSRLRGLAMRRWRPTRCRSPTLIVASADFEEFGRPMSWRLICPHQALVRVASGHQDIFDSAPLAIISQAVRQAMADREAKAA